MKIGFSCQQSFWLAMIQSFHALATMLTGPGDFTDGPKCWVIINFQMIQISNNQKYLLKLSRDKRFLSSPFIKMTWDEGQVHWLDCRPRSLGSSFRISVWWSCSLFFHLLDTGPGLEGKSERRGEVDQRKSKLRVNISRLVYTMCLSPLAQQGPSSLPGSGHLYKAVTLLNSIS